MKWAQWDKTQSRELLVCSYVCALHCAQLLHTILHRTDLIVFPLTLQTITTSPMMSIWGKGGSSICSWSKSLGYHCLFYRPAVLPINQSTASKHKRKHSAAAKRTKKLIILHKWRLRTDQQTRDESVHVVISLRQIQSAWWRCEVMIITVSQPGLMSHTSQIPISSSNHSLAQDAQYSYTMHSAMCSGKSQPSTGCTVGLRHAQCNVQRQVSA